MIIHDVKNLHLHILKNFTLHLHLHSSLLFTSYFFLFTFDPDK